jgi:phosphoglycolate phosphatase-like HAD superfamily hydrolase
MSAPGLLLWDIDGTLVNMDRAGERSLLETLRAEYQRDFGHRLPVDLQGRTDTSIIHDLLDYLKLEGTPEELKKFCAAYLAGLPQSIRSGKPRVLPGVKAALEAVRTHPELHSALLTGNLHEGARLKLSFLGLWDYFDFGAFADDSGIRDELGPFALRRAKERLGIDFPPNRVFIIGDTPHDIACGKAIGANTICVATGAFTVDELKAFSPTHVLPDLSDTAAFLKLVL